MNRGKRYARRHYDFLRDEVAERPRPKKEIIDPHPESFVVKVKLRNGGELLRCMLTVTLNRFRLVPHGNVRRIGVTVEEFLSCQQLQDDQLLNHGFSVDHSGDTGKDSASKLEASETDGIRTNTPTNADYDSTDQEAFNSFS
jgi:hypothetical protein